MGRAGAEEGRQRASRAQLMALSVADLQPQGEVGGPVDWAQVEQGQVEQGQGPRDTPGQIIERYGQAGEQALRVLLHVREVEAVLTADFLAALPAGVRPEGLQWRVKPPASLARKIADRMEQRYLSAEDAAQRCQDVLRYTAVAASPTRLVAQAGDLVKSLQGRGWQVVQAEQSYVDERGRAAAHPYKGLHLIMRRDGPEGGDGVVVEVQVHSEDSMAAKDDSHADYERERDSQVAARRRARAREGMVQRWSQVGTPRGLSGLKELGGAPVEVKRYPDPYRRR